MTPGRLRTEVVAERAAWVRDMLQGIRDLPLSTYEAFLADRRNIAAAESYLRRALEALLDLGRHLLAKGLGRATTEYKEIADALVEHGVLDAELGGRLREMAGYRNRLVHLYDEIAARELYQICSTRQHEIESVVAALLAWISAQAEREKQSDPR